MHMQQIKAKEYLLKFQRQKRRRENFRLIHVSHVSHEYVTQPLSAELENEGE